MLSSEQLTNAGIIVSIGSSLGANSKQLLAAIEAALVESNLVNVRFGDRDSLGLFQQRPSQGWGSQSQVLDPYYSANAFFVGAGTNRGALQVSQAGSAGAIAQRVQRSAFPGKYDQRESEATKILAQLGVYDAGPSNDVVASYGDWPVENLAASEPGIGTVVVVGLIALVAVFVITR